MKSFWELSAQEECQQRLQRLTAESRGQWGKMTIDQMLSHLSDACRMALGELATTNKSGPLQFRPLAKAVIYWLPWPKGAPTAPELLSRVPVSVEAEKQDLQLLLDRLVAKSQQQEWPAHPAFGALSNQDWGRLIYRHLDHHFKQFGV